MRHRCFHDSSGREWTVSEVTKGLPTFAARPPMGKGGDARPVIGTRRLPSTFVAAPWLRFESRHEQRRLDRVPHQWDILADVELQRLLDESDVVPPGHTMWMA